MVEIAHLCRVQFVLRHGIKESPSSTSVVHHHATDIEDMCILSISRKALVHMEHDPPLGEHMHSNRCLRPSCCHNHRSGRKPHTPGKPTDVATFFASMPNVAKRAARYLLHMWLARPPGTHACPRAAMQPTRGTAFMRDPISRDAGRGEGGRSACQRRRPFGVGTPKKVTRCAQRHNRD